MRTMEVNFDGLVGPLHHFAGLAQGNKASMRSQGGFSNPKKAALQGMDKMALVRQFGVAQCFLPPHRRPAFGAAKSLGVDLAAPSSVDPEVLSALCSSSAMWTANAATVAPSWDSQSGALSLVAADLSTHLHRGLETQTTLQLLRQALPGALVETLAKGEVSQGDEGAANHMRMAPSLAEEGMHVFVYGADPRDATANAPVKFPARQTKQASEAVADQLGLPSSRCLFLQQSVESIEAGVFHNDVISTAHLDLFLVHEKAFESSHARQQIEEMYASLFNKPLRCLVLPNDEVPLELAVSSYLFNSQLVTSQTGEMILIAPQESASGPVRKWVDKHLMESGVVDRVEFVDLTQSMRNGGGPACLRLRVAMTEEQYEKVPEGIRFTDAKEKELRDWVQTYYPERVSRETLLSASFLHSFTPAFDALEQIIGMQIPLC